MHNDVPVLDMHGHVSVPFGANSFLMLMMGSNTPMTSPIGAAMLPQDSAAPDLSGCLDELDRCVRDYGFVVAYVSPDPAGRRTTPGMHEPYWFPLYERAQELGIPLIVHGTNSLDPRYRLVPHNYQLGFLTEQYHGDVFTRYPELKVVICHCGGALDRFILTDHHIAQRDLSENLFYDTCGYDLNFLEAAIKQRGVGRMLFGPGVSDEKATLSDTHHD